MKFVDVQGDAVFCEHEIRCYVQMQEHGIYKYMYIQVHTFGFREWWMVTGSAMFFGCLIVL
jgi:hypothetical protein